MIFFTADSLWAKEKYTVTILPFAVHSSEKIDYIKNGIEDMLTSRISSSNKITVTKKETVLAHFKKAKIKEVTANNVHAIGKKLNSDYVVWGSITKIGNSISIDGKLVNMAKGKSDIGLAAQSQNIDDVIPKINEFSESILTHILGTTAHPPTPPPAAAVTPPPAPSTSAASRESQIIAGMRSGGKKRGTFTSVINTELINASDPINQRGFWMSQKIPTEFKGMDIGDVNNDKLNEVVTIDKNNVYVYQKTEKDLKLLEKIKGQTYDNYIAVDVADISRNNVNEIIVTSMNDNNLDYFVMELKEGK
jgi:TolB-like protein